MNIVCVATTGTEEATVEPPHNGHLGDRRKLALWRSGHYGEAGV